MPKLDTNRRQRLLLVAAVGAMLVSGAAFAAIPDSAGVIHACYDRGGNLRLTDAATGTPKACTKSETDVSWNAAGPPGPQGARGAQGVPGIQGPAGPSDGYLLPTPGPVTISTALNPTPVASLLVRDGRYLVTGVVALRNPTATAETVDCWLADVDHGQSLPGSGATLNYVTVPAGGATQSTAIGSVAFTGLTRHPLELRCAFLPGGGTQVWTRGVLEAIKVGELNAP